MEELASTVEVTILQYVCSKSTCTSLTYTMLCDRYISITLGWSRWTWNTSLSTDTSGIYLQTQKCMENTSWELIGVPHQQKRIYRPTQNSVGWRNWGGGGARWLVGLDLLLAGGGTEAGVQSPHRGIWVKGETFTAERETADLWQPKWNENQTVLTAATCTLDAQWLGAEV